MCSLHLDRQPLQSSSWIMMGRASARKSWWKKWGIQGPECVVRIKLRESVRKEAARPLHFSSAREPRHGTGDPPSTVLRHAAGPHFSTAHHQSTCPASHHVISVDQLNLAHHVNVHRCRRRSVSRARPRFRPCRQTRPATTALFTVWQVVALAAAQDAALIQAGASGCAASHVQVQGLHLGPSLCQSDRRAR